VPLKCGENPLYWDFLGAGYPIFFELLKLIVIYFLILSISFVFPSYLLIWSNNETNCALNNK
jgi:hypothetical protein